MNAHQWTKKEDVVCKRCGKEAVRFTDDHGNAHTIMNGDHVCMTIKSEGAGASKPSAATAFHRLNGDLKND